MYQPAPIPSLLTAGQILGGIGAAARGPRPFTESVSFPKQWPAIITRERFGALMNSRRAGKTETAVIKTAKRNTEEPGRRVLYINLTALNAHQQFYLPLTERLRAHGVESRDNASNLLLYFANGSFVRAMGCDDIGEVKKKLGDKWDEIIIDEMQSYAEDVLVELIDRAAMPTLIDRGGSLWLLGTPPVTLAGYWFEIVTGKSREGEVTVPFFRFTDDRMGPDWTLHDNPYIGHDALAVYSRRGIGPGHPVWEREVCGRIVVDTSTIVYCYESGKNDLPAGGRPDPDSKHWRYALGVDLGFHDATAMVVLGWRMDDPQKRLWECYAWQQRGCDYFKVAEKFKEVVERWSPQGVCIDTGGGGAKQIMESLKGLFSSFAYKMKPASVPDSIGMVNDEFRSGRLLVDPEGPIAHDARLVVWKAGAKRTKADDISSAFHSDIMDALRYAHSVAYHYQAESMPTEYEDDDNSREAREARFIRQWERRTQAARDPYGPTTRRGRYAA